EESSPRSVLARAELAKASSVHALHALELLRLPGVQGVGIAQSADDPGEAAIVVYVQHGAAHSSIPADLDGVRTRIRETSPSLPAARGCLPARCSRPPPRPAASH